MGLFCLFITCIHTNKHSHFHTSTCGARAPSRGRTKEDGWQVTMHVNDSGLQLLLYPAKVEGGLFRSVTHPPSKFPGNPFRSFCVFLPTNQPTDNRLTLICSHGVSFRYIYMSDSAKLILDLTKYVAAVSSFLKQQYVEIGIFLLLSGTVPLSLSATLLL